MALLQRIQERIQLISDEGSFIQQQQLMNMCDSLKDGYSISGECLATFKNVLFELYGVNAPGNYKIPLGNMEKEIDELATLGPPPEKISFLRIELRNKVQPIIEDHLPAYVKKLVQDSGYKPSTIQPTGKTVLLCYSEFDPAGREIHDVEHWGPGKGETITLTPDILRLLGLPDTTITCTCNAKDPLTYRLHISGSDYSVGDTVTIPTEGPSKFNEGKYFTGNTEKNNAIMDLCNKKNIDTQEIKKYAIAKLLGDKLQVIGSLQYIISRGGTNDSVCLFTTDKVVAMLCRILGVSSCLQDHDDDEDIPVKEVKMCRVKYYPTLIDPDALYAAQIDREVAMCISHNNEVRRQLVSVLSSEPLMVASTRIDINTVRSFLGDIRDTIEKINLRIADYSVRSKNLRPAVRLLKFAQRDIRIEAEYAKGLHEFKLIANTLKVNMIISNGKALQSASRLFQKGSNMDDIVDPIAKTGKTFGVHLLNLNGGNDNEYKKAYARKRGGQSGGHTDLGDIAEVTTRFLDAAKQAIVLLRNGLTPLLPEVEAEEESVAPAVHRTDIAEMSDSDSASGTQQFGEDVMDSESGSDAPVDAPVDAPSPGSAPAFAASLASGPGSAGNAAYTTSIATGLSFSASSPPQSQMASPERPATGTKTARNEPTNPANDSQKFLRRSLEGDLNQANQTNQKGGYKFVRNDDVYPTLSGGLNDNTAAIDFCYDNDEYDILYLLYSFLTYLGETPFTPEVIEYLVLQIITNDPTLVELEELYKGRYEEQEQEPEKSQEGGKPKRKTRKRKEPKLKGILKTRNKKKYEVKTRRSKRKTRK